MTVIGINIVGGCPSSVRSGERNLTSIASYDDASPREGALSPPVLGPRNRGFLMVVPVMYELVVAN